MSQSEEDYQEFLEDLLYGPPIVYSVMVCFTDGSTRMYAFSDEDTQTDYVEYLKNNGEDLGMVYATLHESVLDFTHTEYEYFNKVH